MSRLFQRIAVPVAAGAVGLAVLSGCGGGDPGQDGERDVASISTPATGGGSLRGSTDPAAGRPQIRLDSTREEINRMYDAWVACLEDHGVRKSDRATENTAGKRACAGKEPLDPPELDPARNPDYSDDVRTMVACMNAHGVKSVVMESGWGLEDGASLSAPHYEETLTTCQVKAFGADD
ncbi:hypothetical protein [Streptomyces sp. NPDC101249]|uniref:hypothetical protein n=1 Tax=Streptomyces sp. NPDC101249 TaxID=3366140 RepID=UPI0038098ADF